jgi:glycosyltransferase involved in cell wall biosynthesis
MKKIIAFTKYSYEGPSSRYRYYNYAECFEKQGIAMTMSPLFTSAYFKAGGKGWKLMHVLKAYLSRIFLLLRLLAGPKKYDLFIIEYELFPFFPALFEWLLRRRGFRYIVDYDDAVFHKYDMHRNRLMRMLLGKKIGQVMKTARAVIVCNAYLERYARRFNQKTLRLPTVVILDRYKAAAKRHVRRPEKPFTVGWIGSKSTSVYLLGILPAIEKFASAHDVRFNFVGFDERVLPEGMKARCKINVIAWSETTEIEEILNFDVGIMPLPGDPWSEGKCGFKLVQYMSCKKPVVASPVGINTALVEEGVNGFLAEENDAWYQAFEMLYRDNELRRKMADAGFSKILKDYNHEINCRRYVQLIGEEST